MKKRTARQAAKQNRGEETRKRIDEVQVVRDIEDRVIPRLRFSFIERVVYYHLVRHSLLEGRRTTHTSLSGLSLRTLLSMASARRAVWDLARRGVVRILKRGYRGYLLEVMPPDEIPDLGATAAQRFTFDPETADFFCDPALRETIFRREGNRCFYCHKVLRGRVRVLDHVAPRQPGEVPDHTYRNLVASCNACNLSKRERPAQEHLRSLYRGGRLSGTEFRERRGALRDLTRGLLKPVFDRKPAARRRAA
jgi:hypothetical protein